MLINADEANENPPKKDRYSKNLSSIEALIEVCMHQ
jgi:hypothetical protein